MPGVWASCPTPHPFTPPTPHFHTPAGAWCCKASALVLYSTLPHTLSHQRSPHTCPHLQVLQGFLVTSTPRRITPIAALASYTNTTFSNNQAVSGGAVAISSSQVGMWDDDGFRQLGQGYAFGRVHQHHVFQQPSRRWGCCRHFIQPGVCVGCRWCSAAWAGLTGIGF